MTEKENSKRLKYHTILAGMVICIFLVISGYLFYKQEENRIVKQKEIELKSISELKVNQIKEWYIDNLDDSKVISRNIFLQEFLLKALEKNNIKDVEKLILFLKEISEEHGLEDIFIADINGKRIYSIKEVSENTDLKFLETIKKVVNRREALSTFLYLNKELKKITIDFIAPILKNGDIENVLVFRLEPEGFLYPLILSDPNTSITSESYLCRQDGDSVLILSDLRFRENAALKLKISLSEKNVSAVQAVTRKKGLYEGKDYRNENVLSYFNNIPGTPWIIVSEIDKNELFSELEEKLIIIAVIVFLAILFVISGMALLYNNKRKNILQKLLHSKQEFRTTLYSIGDAVITTDSKGNVQMLNPVAENLTGWKENEAIDKPIEEIFKIITEETRQKVESPVKKVLENGRIVGLANHTLLISKDGREIPIADSGAPINNDKGRIEGVVLVFRDQTAERENRKNLEESEKRFRSSMDNMIEGAQIIDFNWNYIYLNEAAEIQGNLKKENLIGKNFKDIWPGITNHPIFEVLKDCMDNRKSRHIETSYTFPGNIFRYFEISVQPIPEGIFILSLEITQKKIAENEIRKISKAVTQSPVIVVITNKSGNIEYVNPKFTEVTGYSGDEAKGKNPKILRSGYHSKEFYKELWDTIIEGKDWHGEFLNKKKNGEFYWENAFISPLFDNENNITHFVAVKEDITEKKKMLEELITARDKAEEMNRVKSLFFANMSHELRTPFVAIMGFSELLYETLENPEHKEMAEGIMNTSNRMLATLTKILNLTKSEFEKETALQSEVDMIRLIEDIYRQFSVAAARKNVKLLKSIKFDELIMHTDGNLVSEILNNLINNSLKFTDKGSIEISAQIIQKENKNILELKVSDTGIGIPKDKQDLIWEEFRQASEGTTRTYQGTGLGLTIVRRYAEILGGKTYVESEEMKGATFIVELPLANHTEKVLEK